jgi:subtilase family serine protease
MLGQQSCAEFEGEHVVPADVSGFQAQYHLRSDPFNVVGPNSGQYQGEGVLDIEYIMAAAQGINTTMWSIPWTEFGKDLLNYTLQVQAAQNPPMVHSISWGSGETDSASYDLATMVRINTEFMKMGLAGMSVLVASGDQVPHVDFIL